MTRNEIRDFLLALFQYDDYSLTRTVKTCTSGIGTRHNNDSDGHRDGNCIHMGAPAMNMSSVLLQFVNEVPSAAYAMIKSTLARELA